MLAEAIRIAIMFIMANHMYTIGGEKKKQTKGGPIGLDLTGEVAAIFMAWWDKKFKSKLQELSINVIAYKRYVDDIDMVLNPPEKGMKYNRENNTITMDKEQLEKDNETPTDQRTMNLIQEIGDEITPSIKLEADYPSRHTDNKMPILVLKVWIEQREKDESKEKETLILHEFYHKSIASKAVINAKSAMDSKTKRTVLTQEVLRVLLRCSPDLPWKRTSSLASEMVKRIQQAGYSKKFRQDIVHSALKAYKTIKEKDEKNEIPMYRPKEWKQTEREKSKREKRENWYRKGGHKTVVFIPATPGSKLKRTYEEVIERSGVRMKVVEKAGRSLKRRIQKSNPLDYKECGDSDCIVCREGKGEREKGKCRRENITYEIECTKCGMKYIGESARNAKTRGNEHMYALRKKANSSVLYRHVTQEHKGEKTPPAEKDFQMTVTKVFKDPLSRQLNEAVKIKNQPNSMNTRQEWGHTQLPRVQLTVD